MSECSVGYVCDKKACNYCTWPECKHTTDICHAVNFRMLGARSKDKKILFIEKEDEEAN